jgi:antirestriction protein ArdC
MPKTSPAEKLAETVADLAQKTGRLPWSCPWSTAPDSLPHSLATRRPYSGGNEMLLVLAGSLFDSSSPYFGTYNTIRRLGGSVRKGERAAARVFFWKWIRAGESSDSAESEETPRGRIFPMVRVFSVFHSSQADDLPTWATDPAPEPEKLSEPETVTRAESIIRDYQTRYNSRPPITRADSAWYRPTTDTIGIPAPETFRASPYYYSTLFHELTHSTGHSLRLDRLKSGGFGSDPYAREELVAELGSTMLLSHSGILADLEHSASYVSSWLRRIKSDPRTLPTALAQASRATRYILTGSPDAPEPEPSED